MLLIIFDEDEPTAPDFSLEIDRAVMGKGGGGGRELVCKPEDPPDA